MAFRRPLARLAHLARLAPGASARGVTVLGERRQPWDQLNVLAAAGIVLGGSVAACNWEALKTSV